MANAEPALTLESILAPSSSTTWVFVDGECVIFDEATGALTSLNITASALWACLDGSSTLQDAIADLANVFGAEEAAIRQDLLVAAEDFVTSGVAVVA